MALVANFIHDLSNFANNLSLDCKELRSCIEKGPLDSSFDKGSSLHCAPILEQLQQQTCNIIESLERISDTRGLKGPVSFKNLLLSCTQLYEENEKWRLATEDCLEQYGYSKQEETSLLNVEIH